MVWEPPLHIVPLPLATEVGRRSSATPKPPFRRDPAGECEQHARKPAGRLPASQNAHIIAIYGFIAPNIPAIVIEATYLA